MYLEKRHVEKLLESIKMRFNSSSRFIFTFMDEAKPGNYMFKDPSLFLKLYLRLKNEPFFWGIIPERLESFLSTQGWKLVEVLDHVQLKASYLRKENQDLPIAIGEFVAICEIQKK